MITLFILYAILVIGIALWYRKHNTGDEYLMGDRRTSALLVAAALFTLVGGGELVTLTSLAFTFGYAGIALFVGYALGFCFLGIISSRIRKDALEHLYLSLPDYAHKHFGKLTGQLVYLISLGAFFSMLMIQFTAGGQLLNALTGISYENSILLTAAICIGYLFIGGFKTVLATDLLQGIARILLMPILIYVAAKGLEGPIIAHSSEQLPLSIWISLVITGFFSASSSADVWQRIYVAKSDAAAKRGLIGGAFLLLLFGAMLVALGLVAKSAGTISNADSAFIVSLSSMLPKSFLYIAVLLVISVIMSTADTEIFLLSGMTQREILRLKGIPEQDISRKQSILFARILMLFFAVVAISLSFYFRELVTIYTWLLSTLLVMSPMVIFSLFIKNKNPIAAKASLILNLIIFVGLVYLGLLTPENAYYIVLPGAVIYIIMIGTTNKSIKTG